MKKIFPKGQNGKERRVGRSQMWQLFITSCITLVLTMLNRNSHLLLYILVQLNTKHVHCVNAIVVEPGLGHVEIDDGLAEIFEDEFDICHVLIYEKTLLLVNFDFWQLVQDLLDLLQRLWTLRHLVILWNFHLMTI